jgi:hypothetical protein
LGDTITGAREAALMRSLLRGFDNVVASLGLGGR